MKVHLTAAGRGLIARIGGTKLTARATVNGDLRGRAWT